MTIDLHEHLSSIATLIADPSRAKILCSLMDGRAYTATELSVVAEISASTTSVHLTKLESQGFITLLKQGRYRYFRLASEEIANALEILMNLTLISKTARNIKSSTPLVLRLSRSCYHHLAGKIAVKMMEIMHDSGWIIGDEQYTLSELGQRELKRMGFNLEKLSLQKTIAKNCLDWSERKYHLSGALGTQLLIFFEQKKWIERYPQSREVIWTHAGKQALKKYFEIDYTEIALSDDLNRVEEKF